MRTLVEYELEEGKDERVFVELVTTQEGPRAQRAGRGEAETVVKKAKQSFSQALDAVRPAAAMLVSKLSALPTAPDKVEIKFGLTFESEAGAIFASVGAKANFQVTLAWGEKKVNLDSRKT